MRLAPLIALATLLVALPTVLVGQPPADPFAFLYPSVVVSADDRQRLDRGESVVHMLPSDDGEVAVFAALEVKADGERLALWVRDIAQLKKSVYVKAIARFSDSPRLEDLDAVVLNDDDLQAIAECHPGDCKIKLTAPEVASLQQTMATAQGDWKPAVQGAFRRLMLERVQAYLASGLSALPPYVDERHPVSLPEVFSSLLRRRSVYLTKHVPLLVEYLEQYPQGPALEVDSFLYWSAEQLKGRPIISATHVNILKSDNEELPEVLVASKQIFATHYLNGSLNITAMLWDRSRSTHYLVYVNRSRIDILDRWFARMARTVIARRLENEAPEMLRGVRRRLESGEPPSSHEATPSREW